MERPKLQKNLDSKIFREFYYLKEELVDFCREYQLPTSGGKQELTERIAHFLDTGLKDDHSMAKSKKSRTSVITSLSLNSIIEPDFICSEVHRALFKEQIGSSFSFNVAFQKWLKSNTGKTYQEAVNAYYQIKNEKKHSKTSIDSQFEYNTYIRDFFDANRGKSLEQAIQCWKYKKCLPGHNRYEESDLVAINDEGK